MNTRPVTSLPAGIRLQDILPDSQSVGSTGRPPIAVRSTCGRWNECQPNDVFVAINEPDSDGHDFVAEAIQRGAIAVVGERLTTTSKPQFLVDDSRVAYGKICHALAGSPSHRMATVGVSGTCGKTVVSHLIQNILEASGHSTGLSSSIETRFGESPGSPEPASNAPTIANQLAKMVIGKCSHTVIEASSIALAQRSLSGIALDAAVLTNIQRSNLEYHGTVGNYQNAQARIFDYLKSTGFAVVNADDKWSGQILDEIAVPTLTYGIHNKAEVTAKMLDRNRCYQTFLLTAGIESVVVRTATIGKQHVYNCLAAATVGLTFGIDLQVIASALETAKTPGRLERLDCGQDFGLWIDSSLSPSQLNGALTAIGPICEGRLWCVCSTHESQSDAERKRIGEILECKTEKPIITQAVATVHTDFEPCHQVLDGFANSATAHVMPDRVKAIEWALSQAAPEDAVLICGSGEKPIATCGDNQWKITDRDICTFYFREKTMPNLPTHSNPANGGSQTGIYNIDDYR